MLVQISKAIVVVAISSALGLGAAWGQAQQQTQQKKVKDQGEYDLFTAIAKETNAEARLKLLNQWKEKYPTTDYKLERAQFFLTTAGQLNRPLDVIAAAKEILEVEPTNIQALTSIAYYTLYLQKPTPDDLGAGEKAANGMISVIDKEFAPEKKPADVKEADWKNRRVAAEAIAYRTLGWVAMQRKENEAAEKAFAKGLQLNAEQGEISYWLGTVIRAQKKPERQAEALFHFARAACYSGPGALNEAGRKSIEAYLNKFYTAFHGQDPAGLQQLCDQAKASAFPPADFKILTEAEIAAHKEEQLTKENPQLAFWLKLKAALQEPSGEQYFESGMKDAMVPPEGQPPLKGILISQDPAKNPKTLVLGLSGATTPEVTLRLETPLVGRADPGTALEFRGEAKSFTKEPFMVIFSAEKASISGWPAPPPPAKKAVPKKGVVKKKK